jgi:hypothetical protein
MKAFGTLTTVFMLGELSQHKAQDFTQFEKAINDIPEIVECWALGGGYDYLLKFVCSSIDAYQKLVERILDQEVGMTRYYTYVVTKPIKLQPAPPLFVLEPIIKESSATCCRNFFCIYVVLQKHFLIMLSYHRGCVQKMLSTFFHSYFRRRNY